VIEMKKDKLVPAGILVLIGGKENKGEKNAPDRKNPNGYVSEEVLRIFCSLSHKKHPNIEVITSGSAEEKETFAEYKKVFAELGRRRVTQIHHNTREEVIKDDLIARLDKADAIFIAGGDQLLITSLYGGTDFLNRLKERYIKERIIIGGTSAGAMAISTPMIYAGNQEVQQLSGEIKVTVGLELLKDVCVDTHFVHRSRFVRLAQVIATNPGCLGLGIEEDTAVIVRNGSEGEVAGSGTIIKIDGTSIPDFDTKKFSEKKAFSVKNLTVDILSAGDCFVMKQAQQLSL